MSVLNSSYKWSMYLAKHRYEDEVLQFADEITKINSRGRRQPRLIAITDVAMYNLTDRIEVKRRVEIENIMSITVSQPSNQFVVHVPSEYDYWFESLKRDKMIRSLTQYGQHIEMFESDLSKLGELVQKKNEKDKSGIITIDEKTSLPPLPGLKHICMFKGLKDKRQYTRAELITTEQSYCKSLVQFLALFAYPLDIERNRLSVMTNRNKWIDIFDNFENIVRFHCDFFCPDLQKCCTRESISVAVDDPKAWAAPGSGSPSARRRSSRFHHVASASSPLTGTMSRRASEFEPHQTPGSSSSGKDRRRSHYLSPSATYLGTNSSLDSKAGSDSKEKLSSPAENNNEITLALNTLSLGSPKSENNDDNTNKGQEEEGGGPPRPDADVGAAFNKRVSLLKTVYEPYLANWTKLQELVKKLQEKSKYAKFFKKQQELCGGLSVSAYLIMPIQRVPRYVLLIKELVKYTDSTHPEYASLQKALKSIQKIAKVCDSYIK
mmetsp:Transcript_4210/g.7686  ORF Transcript_4210/g.7686 Transcript_4210/m.7686 type:complete len:493 (+) Transcript_4210:228-1706(+)